MDVTPGAIAPTAAEPPAETIAGRQGAEGGGRPADAAFDRAIELPTGLPGFPAATRFRLAPLAGASGPFWFLRSADDAGPGLVVAPLAPDAGLIERADIERACHDLGLAADDVLVLLVLNPRPKEEGGVALYANLRAPLLIDAGRRIAYQHVLANPRYPIRHRLDGAAAGA